MPYLAKKERKKPAEGTKLTHDGVILDTFSTLAEDFTKSNTWTGEASFDGKCLHHLQGGKSNPYQTVISSLGRTLGDLDEENEIPAYGFGDVKTKDHSVFPFKPDGSPCH